MAPPLHSCLVRGRVYHRRTRCESSAAAHSLEYAVWMAYVDLDEAEPAADAARPTPLERAETRFAGLSATSASRLALARWRRADHFGPPDKPLRACVRELLAERAPEVASWSAVRVLTNLAPLGAYNFNPVSVFYCLDGAGALGAVVLEVTNTPWLERRLYVVRPDPATHRARWEKDFHVSPFLDRLHDYEWTLRAPFEAHDPDALRVRAVSTRRLVGGVPARGKEPAWPHAHVVGAAPCAAAGAGERGEVTFVVGLELERVPLERAWLAVLADPLMPASAVLWIHLDALRVWLKGNAYVAPPPGARRMRAADLAKHLALFAAAALARALLVWPARAVLAALRRLGCVAPDVPSEGGKLSSRDEALS